MVRTHPGSPICNPTNGSLQMPANFRAEWPTLANFSCAAIVRFQGSREFSRILDRYLYLLAEPVKISAFVRVDDSRLRTLLILRVGLSFVSGRSEKNAP